MGKNKIKLPNGDEIRVMFAVFEGDALEQPARTIPTDAGPLEAPAVEGKVGKQLTGWKSSKQQAIAAFKRSGLKGFAQVKKQRFVHRENEPT